MKKILIHSIAFSPDGVSTAYIYNDISVKLKEEGYEVIVLTTTPHYNVVAEEIAKQPLTPVLFGLYYKSKFRDITVLHIPQKKYKSSLLRLLGFIRWHIVSFCLALFQRDIDIIISPSPPLTLGFVNIIIGFFKRAKVIYNVQEIYPDLLIEEGGLRSSIIIRILKKLEKFVYNHSDAVITIDQVFYNTISSRFKDVSKLHIIPNFVDIEIYKPEIAKEIPGIFEMSDSLKLMYAGNIGHAQDWVTLISLAKKLQNDNFEFYIIGEGVMRQYLESEIKEHQLDKVHLLSYQPRHLMPSLIACADIQFVFMAPHTEGHGFPSKVYTIMACEKPMLVSSGMNTPIVNFLSDKKCAMIVTEKESDKKVDEIISVLRSTDRNQLKQMGYNGYIHVCQNYSKEVVTSKYHKLINTMLS